MPKDIESMATAVGGTILGGLFQNHQQNKAYHQQKNLMDKQKQNQKELNEQGQQLQMKTWRETNFPAQVEMMKDAGLSVGMMYGGGGQGGATTGGQGGGSASGGNAPAPMDISQMAQVGLMIAQAKKLNAETKNIEEDTGLTRQKGIAQHIANAIEQWRTANPEERDTTLWGSKRYGWQSVDSKSIIADREKMSNQEIEQKIANLGVQKKLDEAKINLTDEQAGKVMHEIIQGYMIGGAQLVNSILGNLVKYVKRAQTKSGYKVDSTTGAVTEWLETIK